MLQEKKVALIELSVQILISSTEMFSDQVGFVSQGKMERLATVLNLFQVAFAAAFCHDVRMGWLGDQVDVSFVLVCCSSLPPWQSTQAKLWCSS